MNRVPVAKELEKLKEKAKEGDASAIRTLSEYYKEYSSNDIPSLYDSINTLMSSYLLKTKGANEVPVGYYSKIEPRTRDADYTEAMSFEISDPLWMLGRQWQFGRFQGNDCGSTVMTQITVNRQKIDKLLDKNNLEALSSRNGNHSSFSTERPLEYDVERRPHEIDPYARIESALHFLGMKSVAKHKDTVLKVLKNTCKLEPFVSDNPENPLEEVKVRVNTKLDKLYRFYGNKCFDGYKLYKLSVLPAECSISDSVLTEYKNWFKKKYHVMTTKEDAFWNGEKLGYEVGLIAGDKIYMAEDYHSGRLSWYSFDRFTNFSYQATPSPEKVTLGALPSPAVFPAAPNRRLWEFENRKVQFNDYRNDDVSALASSVILQYTMMYSNDWMIVPLETEIGTVLQVEKITVTDSFGNTHEISNSFEDIDKKKRGVGFTDRWALFANSSFNAYEQGYFESQPGLLCPPTLQRVEQGAPIEEVQFLRDEMANMVWGVEEKVSDGCGGSLDSRSRSDSVLSIVDEERKVDDSDVVKPEDADYAFLIQNRVPLHWIPFIPQKIYGKTRDIVFRRARMPIWYKGDFRPALPSSQLLAVKKDGARTIPRYVNEEEILGYGTKVGLYPQRTRWFNGTSFTWQGFEKKISGVQANSGLMFDALLDVEKKEESND